VELEQKNVDRAQLIRKPQVQFSESVSNILSKIRAKVGRDGLNLREKFSD